MNRSIALLLALSLAYPALSQEDAPVYGAFIQRLDVSTWHGHRIRITAAIRTQCLDSDAGASVWARVDNTDKTMGFIFDPVKRPIRDTSWKVYTITGKLDKKAKTLYVGGMYRHKGYFWFDDFHVYIKTSPFKWTEMPLDDAGFEDDTAAFRWHWPVIVARPFFNLRLTDTAAFEGKYCLLADGAAFVKPDTHGNNDTAGHFLDTLHLDSVHVVGWSDGGKTGRTPRSLQQDRRRLYERTLARPGTQATKPTNSAPQFSPELFAVRKYIDFDLTTSISI